MQLIKKGKSTDLNSQLHLGFRPVGGRWGGDWGDQEIPPTTRKIDLFPCVPHCFAQKMLSL